MTESNGRTSDARDAILASIRQSLAASQPFDAQWRSHHKDREVSDVKMMSLSRDELVENFRVNFESLGGHFYRVATEADAAAVARSVSSDLKARRVAISDSELVKNAVQPDMADEIIENAPAAVLFECDLGITSAQWAMAETGTLVLESDKEFNRLTSLVPPIHLCLLKASNIRQTMGEILELTRASLSPAMTFITGASRTSDIELTLAIGVHGPQELHVVVIDD